MESNIRKSIQTFFNKPRRVADLGTPRWGRDFSAE